MNEAVRGLSGGAKQMFLRQNRAQVLRYYHDWGPERTCEEYRLKPVTLERLLTKGEVNYDRMAKSDKALIIAMSARDTANESRARVNELERIVLVMEPYVKAAYALSRAVQMMALLPESEFPSLRERPSLDISDVRSNGGKS